jgi:hypothetical protein
MSYSWAISTVRPWTYLLAHGVLPQWVVDADPAVLIGERVAIHSGPKGWRGELGAQGYKELDHLLEGWPLTHDRRELQRLCPHDALVGVVEVRNALPVDGGWRLWLVGARPIEPIRCEVSGADIFALRQEHREAISQAMLKGRAA